MADIVDMASGLEAEHFARAWSRVRASMPRRIPAGVAGICDGCGEDMPRLVNGRCGYCRDGRAPLDRPMPLDRPVRAQSQNRQETETMANTVRIEFSGDAFAVIRAEADQTAVSMAEAARELVLAAAGENDSADAADDLAAIAVEDLLGELARRFETAGMAAALEADLAEATDRAARAEAKLAALREALA